MPLALDALGKGFEGQEAVLQRSPADTIIQAPEIVPQPWVRHSKAYNARTFVRAHTNFSVLTCYREGS
jgi:hypothetical protein